MGRSQKAAAHAQGDESSASHAPSANARIVSPSGSTADSQTRRQSNEESPLLSSNEGDDSASDAGNAALNDTVDMQATKSMWYLIMVTLGIAGLQIGWSVELSNGSPYLLSLGLSKSLMALVWMAGPVTGTLVQPYVGMLSDNCRIPWGKRKPFMLGGTAATVVSLLFLAWAKEIISGFLALFGADPASNGVKVTIIVVAVIGIYILDFAINTVQAAIRAFIVDCAPAHQQEAANAMASRLTGIGNIVGYLAGYSDLTAHLGFLGNTQFQILCVIACILLTLTISLSVAVVRERDPRLDGPPPKSNPNVVAFFFTIFKSIKRLPPQTKRVCQVQFCAWVGFFPLLFYTSAYIGELYVQPFLEENPHMSPEELDKLYEQATRIGTYALLINSIVCLLTNVLLPFFIAPTFDDRPVLARGASARSNSEGLQRDSILDYLRIPGFTLKRAWLASLLIFAGAMFCSVLVRSVEAATFLIGLAGITWAMTLWAPWAIISAEVSRRDALARTQKLRTVRPSQSSSANANAAPPSSDDEEPEEEVDQAGVIIGIHNMAIAAPQIIATIGSSLIFKIWQKPRGTPGDHSIAVVLALGGICVLGSCFFVTQIQESSVGPAGAMGDEEQGQPSGEGRLPFGANTRRRRKSGYEQLPRVSQDHATLPRNRSFGGLRVE